MSNTYSLRKGLVRWIGIPIGLAAALTFLSSFLFARHEIDESYDAYLVHTAKVLEQLTRHEILEDDVPHLGTEETTMMQKYERKTGFRIWRADQLISQSTNTLHFKHFKAPNGFSRHKIGKHEWRFFVLFDPKNNIQIEVSERSDVRYELVGQIMIALIIPGIIFIPLIFFIVLYGVRKTLEPVVRISADVDRRSSDSLLPLKNYTVAEEIAPLVQALNSLFGRIENSFRREREFTGHAAHELRTPLAAMKMQTQVLMKKAKGAPQCKQGLENLQSTIDRSTHLVEQLLSMARIQDNEFCKSKMNLSECLYESVDEIQPVARQKNIAIETGITDHIMIDGNEDSIAILFKNILDNAVKYTPMGGSIFVNCSADGLVEIADMGPGLTGEEKDRAFERFVRLDKTGQPGSGLGLSIVDWIAAEHDVEINLLDNRPKGLKVLMNWNV